MDPELVSGSKMKGLFLMTWVLSALTVANLYLMGNLSIWGPIVGIVAQVLWVYYLCTTRQYGLLPATLAIGAINVRNLIKWRKRR